MFVGQIVNVVVDSLYLRHFSPAFPSEFLLSHIDEMRDYIKNFKHGQKPFFLEIPNLGTFRLKTGGRPPYEIVLINPQIGDIRVWNVDKWHSKAARQTGQIFIDFRSRFLQRGGLAAVRQFLANLQAAFFGFDVIGADILGHSWTRIARMDLAVDMTDHEMMWSDLDNFVCRARKMDVFTHITPADLNEFIQRDLGDDASALDKSVSNVVNSFLKHAMNELSTQGEASLSRVVAQDRKPQTIYFGRFGSQLYARKYNKMATLPLQNKMFMLDIWRANGWDGETQVNRVEFSISGDFLKDFIINGHKDVRDFDIVEHVIPTLWNYLVTEWLTMRKPNYNNDQKSRWDVDNNWAGLFDAFGESMYDDASRCHARQIPENDDHLYKQALGCLVSAAALTNPHLSNEEVMSDVASKLLESFNDDFVMILNERRSEFGLDVYSDTAMTANLRAVRMIENNTS